MQQRLLRLLLFHLFILPKVVVAQHNHQFTLVTDNDSYISVNNDGYYTNGLFAAYQWRKSDSSKRNTDRVHRMYAGHKIYTSRFSGEFYEHNLDRPLTGLLFAGFEQTYYNKQERMINWGLDVGTIGSKAFGKEVQTQAHKVMQIYKPTYWDRQLNDAFGINLHLTWSPQLVANNHSKWDFKPILTGTAGTFFTHAGAGAALVFGKFLKNSASAFWNNHKGSTPADREFFMYLQPMFYLKAYDATVQGGMFNDEPEKIPGKLNPYFLQTKLGGTYSGNRLSVGLEAIYESKQSLTQFSRQYYGSIKVGWMW